MSPYCTPNFSYSALYYVYVCICTLRLTVATGSVPQDDVHLTDSAVISTTLPISRDRDITTKQSEYKAPPKPVANSLREITLLSIQYRNYIRPVCLIEKHNLDLRGKFDLSYRVNTSSLYKTDFYTFRESVTIPTYDRLFQTSTFYLIGLVLRTI